MTVEQLKDRIQKTNLKIEKIERRIKKWQNAQTREAFLKADGWLLNMGRDEEYLWKEYIHNCEWELDHAVQDLHDTQVTLEKYQNLLNLEVVKDNILSVLKSVSYQSVVESLQRRDLYSELNNSEYLYGKGKRIIDKYPQSSICMLKIINIEEINKKYGRDVGTEIIVNISNIIKKSIAFAMLFSLLTDKDSNLE